MHPFENYSGGDLEVVREMLTDEATVIGVADGGAHVGTICDASSPTTLLTHWGRDRRRGEKLPLEFLVKRQTRDTAMAYGLSDRGVLAPGKKADINVIEFDRLNKGFGDRLLIDDLSFKLPPAGIVGGIGPNGAGKTTLFRMITGSEKPDSGTISIGESVKLGYVDQSRDSLDPNATVWEEISDGGTSGIPCTKWKCTGSRLFSCMSCMWTGTASSKARGSVQSGCESSGSSGTSQVGGFPSAWRQAKIIPLRSTTSKAPTRASGGMRRQ